MPTTLDLLREHSQTLNEVIREVRSASADASGSRHEFEAQLAEELVSPASVHNVREELIEDSAEVESALNALVAANGEIPESQFTRDFGVLEIMGEDRLRKEMPWLEARSVSEILYYNGLIGLRIQGLGPEARRVVYMPSDVMAQMPLPSMDEDEVPLAIEPTRPPSDNTLVQMQDLLLNDLGSVLGYVLEKNLRLQEQALHPEDDAGLTERLLVPPDTPLFQVRKRLLLHITRRLGLLKRVQGAEDGPLLTLNGNQVHRFLRLDRNAQRTAMWSAWKDSGQWNDLCQTPTLVCHNEERWKNSPLGTRETFLPLCRSLRIGSWYRVEDLVAAVHDRVPDFQRPGGDYNSWYVWNQTQGAYVRGFENWDLVDGELVRFLLLGPLSWLGTMQQDVDFHTGQPRAVALTRIGAIWLGADLEFPPVAERPLVDFQDDFTLLVPFALSMQLRFRIGRFAMWQASGESHHQYQINQRSLERAMEAGITGDRILEALKGMSRQVPGRLERGIRKYARSR